MLLFETARSVSCIHNDANRGSIPVSGPRAYTSWYILSWTVIAELNFEGPGPWDTNLARTESAANALFYVRMFLRNCFASADF